MHIPGRCESTAGVGGTQGTWPTTVPKGNPLKLHVYSDVREVSFLGRNLFPGVYRKVGKKPFLCYHAIFFFFFFFFEFEFIVPAKATRHATM